MTAVTYPRSGPPGDPGRNWTQPQWRRYHRLDTGIVGSPGGSDRQVFADGSGPYIKRLPGARFIQGIYGADDETWQGTVTANSTGQWRVDRVVDELDEDGVITTVIVPGTAATIPTPPDLEQVEGGVWQEHLGYFRVKPGFTNITSGDAAVVDERRFMAARITPVASEALRPASPRIGDEATYPDGRRERWTGSLWAVTAAPEESWVPAVRSSGFGWSPAAAAGKRSKANGYADGWSVFTLSGNGPAPAGQPALPAYTSVPYEPLAGYKGAAGTWVVVTQDGASGAAGELVIGYSPYDGDARLFFSGGGLNTTNLLSVSCFWHYPAA